MPMVPVEATKTSSFSMPSISAVAPAISIASSNPFFPVEALAHPEFMTIAWAFPSLRCSALTFKGAALILLVVNNAIALDGTSE